MDAYYNRQKSNPVLAPVSRRGIDQATRTPDTAGDVPSPSRGRAFLALPMPVALDTTVLVPVQEVPSPITAKLKGARRRCAPQERCIIHRAARAGLRGLLPPPPVRLAAGDAEA